MTAWQFGFGLLAVFIAIFVLQVLGWMVIYSL